MPTDRRIETLTGLLDQMRASPHLAGIPQTWGDPSEAGPVAAPRITWVPIEGTLASPETGHEDVIEKGARVRKRRILDRRPAVELRLHMDGPPEEAARAIEALIPRIVRALYHIADLQRHLQPVADRWLGPEEAPPGSTVWALRLHLELPIYAEQPAAPVREVTTTGIPR